MSDLTLMNVARACACYRQAAPLAECCRYQEVGNGVTPDWTICTLSEFKHPVS
jgi:hypothetical protein